MFFFSEGVFSQVAVSVLTIDFVPKVSPSHSDMGIVPWAIYPWRPWPLKCFFCYFFAHHCHLFQPEYATNISGLQATNTNHDL